MNSIRNNRWVMLVLIALPGIAINYSQFLISAFSTEFMADFKIGMAQFTSITLSFSLVAAVMAIVGGMLADKLGSRKVLVLFGLVSTIAATARIFTTEYVLFFILSVLSGALFGAGYASSSKVIDAWFSEKRRGLAFSIYCAGGALGVSAAQLTMGIFSGYRQTLIVSAVFMGLVTLLWLVIGNDAPEGVTVPKSASVLKNMGKILRLKNVWIMGIGTALFSSFILAVSSLLPQMLVSSRGMSAVQANVVTAFMNIFAVLGSIVIPFIQAKVGLFKPILVAQFICSAVFVIPVILVPQSIVIIFISITGFCISAGEAFLVTILTNLQEMKREYLGSATGFTTMIKYLLGGFILPTFVVSPLMEMNPDSLVFCGAGACILMIIVTILLPETGEKRKKCPTACE